MLMEWKEKGRKERNKEKRKAVSMENMKVAPVMPDSLQPIDSSWNSLRAEYCGILGISGE